MKVLSPGQSSSEPPLKAPSTPRGVRLWILVVTSSAAFLALGLSAFLLFRPPQPSLTRQEFNNAVESYLKVRPPEPTAAATAYEVIRPSLVFIQAFRTAKDLADGGPSFVGSGVIAEENGTILTCLHVVKNSKSIKVTFADGFESEASVVSTQPQNDLAVLKPAVAPEELKPATFSSTADLRVGDEVVAVGNPFGIPGSVSAGVVSGLGRSMELPESNIRLHNLIQFDAAVNPGNSGGPLLDRKGEVIGIVSSLLNPTKEPFFIGIGFAVTVETAANALGIPPW